MKSFIIGILIAGGTLYYADYSYGTLRPCDMLAKERARDTMGKDGLSIKLVDLAIAKWRAHKAENMSTVDCVMGISQEWWTNVRGIVSLDD